MQALDKSSKEGFRMRSSLIRRSSGAAEMLRRVVRKAVQASRSLPCAENRGSPLLAVLPRSGIDTASENVTGDQWRWHGKDRNFTVEACGEIGFRGVSVTDLLNKHGADENFTRYLHTRAAQHTVGSSTKPTLNLRGLSSLVDAGKSQPPKNNKNDMSVKEDAEAVVADARILKSLAAYLWPKDNPEFRRRVTLALSLLVASKVLNVQVPFMFKYAVDALSAAAGATGATAAASAATTSTALMFATPTSVLLGYGIARAGASACNGLDVCYARVI